MMLCDAHSNVCDLLLHRAHAAGCPAPGNLPPCAACMCTGQMCAPDPHEHIEDAIRGNTSDFRAQP